MPFAEIIAQERAVSSLRAALRRGALHHAYLFGGPQGVGKAAAARLLAQAANCEGPPGPDGIRDDACGTCGPCRKIEKGVHPDVFELHEEARMAKAGVWEPKGGRTPSKFIAVDQIRDLVDHRLALRRFEGRRRFVILDPADAMNPQSQNALLKTLEEPPADTTLVLVTARPDALLPTIRSRCLRVTFVPTPPGAVADRLVAEGRDPEAARLAAALARGSLERALALTKPKPAKKGEEPKPTDLDALAGAIRGAAALDPRDAGRWLAWAAEHGTDREWAGEICEALATWLRDVLAAQTGAATLALPDLSGETRKVADAIAPAEAARRRDEVLRTAAALRQNASPTLALERLLIGWFHGRA
ncbi:MAG TPA: DNA polymerase III subunit delta' [Anaeromyxobacteraceae bacterium]|nr:DNA polymerase III subunit delta' [Anaeromyxobacteraceae bacterium]